VIADDNLIFRKGVAAIVILSQHLESGVAAGGTALDAQVVERLLANDDDGPLKALSQRSTEKHVSSVFAKLGLPDTGTENRRVLAVLQLLRG
jgi:hypothetical protein